MEVDRDGGIELALGRQYELGHIGRHAVRGLGPDDREFVRDRSGHALASGVTGRPCAARAARAATTIVAADLARARSRAAGVRGEDALVGGRVAGVGRGRVVVVALRREDAAVGHGRVGAAGRWETGVGRADVAVVAAQCRGGTVAADAGVHRAGVGIGALRVRGTGRAGR